MRQMHIHGLKILGISFLIDMYHFFLCSPAVNWSLARCNLVHCGGNKPGSARGQDNRSHFYRGSPASPCNYKPPSILQSNFKKVDPSFLSLCNHKCSVFLKTFINALLPCPCPHNWSVKILTVFIQEFILYVFLEKLLYWSTDLLTLRRDMIIVLRVVPLRYTCQKF